MSRVSAFLALGRGSELFTITEQFAVSQQVSSQAHKDTLVSPLLYLSSTAAGWEGLEAQAFHEPMELEGWITPAIPSISLILFTGGVMYLEQRYAQGPWKALYMRQGDLILRSGTNAPYESRWKGLSSTLTQTLHLHLSKDLLARAAEEVGGYDPMHLSLVERSGFQDPLLTQIGFALWRELEQSSPAGKLYAQSAAQMLAVHLLRYYTSPGGTIKDLSQGLTPQQMRRVIDYVQTHLNQDLSLEVLAQQAGYSPYHFTRLFRQTTGESPHHVVLQLRIERAQHLLKRQDMPLADIALESGFANQSHFIQVFKRHLGLTPRAYRQDRSN